MTAAPGRLVVVGTPIGNLGDLSPRGREALAAAELVACEDSRRTGRLFNTLGIPAPRYWVVNEHTEDDVTPGIIDRLLGGTRVVLVSDAGMPAVSDPGSRLIRAAVERGIEVEVVPGPSAVLTALVGSGLVADRFCFEGFLPRRGGQRAERLAGLVGESRVAVLFEAPHRIRRTVADLVEALGGVRRIAICRELTKLHEETWRGTLAEAVEHLESKEPRGEYVLVVEGAERSEADDAAILAALQERGSRGGSRREVVDDVAASLGVGRRRVYELSLASDT